MRSVPNLRTAPNNPFRHRHMRVTSISLDVADLGAAHGLHAWVESAFAEACNLVTTTGQRLSLVSTRVGNGPYNAVVDPGLALCLLAPGDQGVGDGTRLVFDMGVTVDLRGACPWSPRPAYESLAQNTERVLGHVGCLRRALPLMAPPASLAGRPHCPPQGAFGSHPVLSLVQAQAGELAASLLAAYRHHNLAGIQAYARRLAGIGPGLTPAGDDWLAGWLIGLHCMAAVASGQEPLPAAVVGVTVVGASRGRTTGFSLALLEAAARGAVPQPWHDLLHALPGSSSEPIDAAVKEIVRRGATSGFDMLAGFLAAFPAP